MKSRRGAPAHAAPLLQKFAPGGDERGRVAEP